MSYESEYRKIKVGDRVRLREQMETVGGTLLAQGTLMKVIRKHKGLHLETLNDKPCPTCGVGEKKRIIQVLPFSVEIVKDA